MTHDEIKRANLIKMGFQCGKCDKIYDLDHPVNETANFWKVPETPEKILDKCHVTTEPWEYYGFAGRRMARNYNLFKLRGKWYKVAPALVEMFIQLGVIEEALEGHLNNPRPTHIHRQVDVFTLAEKLNVPPPLKDYQRKRAQTKAFVDRIKK